MTTATPIHSVADLAGSGRRVAADYLAAIVDRVNRPLPPEDHEPAWTDRPRPERVYPGAPFVPMPPARPYPSEATLERALAGPPVQPRPFTPALLADMLRDSYGLHGRRTEISSHPNLDATMTFPSALWARGTASGGGIYPVSVYWFRGGARPGVLCYSPRRDGFDQLVGADALGHVRDALGPRTAADADDFLVLGVRFWLSAFKYGSFAPHPTSMDVGTLVQTWRIWCHARGLDLRPELWFDEALLARALRVDPHQEAIAAVVPLRFATTHSGRDTSSRTGGHAVVTHVADERSTTVRSFPLTDRLQDAIVAETEPPHPAPQLPAVATNGGGWTTRLATPCALSGDVRTVLHRRRSSFGNFDATRPMSSAELAALLQCVDAGAAFPCEAAPAGVGEAFTTYVFAQHVEGIERGVYRWDAGTGSLVHTGDAPPRAFLQRRYFLSNYSLEQAGAVLVPTARANAVIDAYGERGLRLLGAATGALTQTGYLAAAALDLGFGAALGFDCAEYVRALGLESRDEIPLIILLSGHDRPGSARYRFDLT